MMSDDHNRFESKISSLSTHDNRFSKSKYSASYSLDIHSTERWQIGISLP